MKTILSAVIAAVLLALSFMGGCQYHLKTNPLAEASHDTTWIYDTMPHQMPTVPPGYIIKHDSIKYRDQKWMDSVLLASKIDTAAILANYFMLNYYTREWEDSLLYAKSEDVITENKFVDNVFTYKIKRPQTVINNVVNNTNYSSYLYTGFSLLTSDYKYSSFNVYFANKNILAGFGYIPYSKGVNVTLGLKLIKFKR